MAVANEPVRFDEVPPKPPDVLAAAKRLRLAHQKLDEFFGYLKKAGFLNVLPPERRRAIDELATEITELSLELIRLLFVEHLERNPDCLTRLLIAEAEAILKHGVFEPQSPI